MDKCKHGMQVDWCGLCKGTSPTINKSSQTKTHQFSNPVLIAKLREIGARVGIYYRNDSLGAHQYTVSFRDKFLDEVKPLTDSPISLQRPGWYQFSCKDVVIDFLNEG
jgi:hypothetical protein